MEWKTLTNHPNYELNRGGQVRNKKSKRILKLVPNRKNKAVYVYDPIKIEGQKNVNRVTRVFIDKVLMEEFVIEISNKEARFNNYKKFLKEYGNTVVRSKGIDKIVARLETELDCKIVKELSGMGIRKQSYILEVVQ